MLVPPLSRAVPSNTDSGRSSGWIHSLEPSTAASSGMSGLRHLLDPGGFWNLGVVPVAAACNAAAQAFTTLSEGADSMAAFAAESVPKVKVIFPDSSNE